MVWGHYKAYFAALIAIFLLGFIAGSVLADINTSGLEMPLSFFRQSSIEVQSPYDHIPEDRIHVFSDRIVMDIENASWAGFTDTNSMDPFIDAGSNSIEIKPASPDDVHVGDVISFRTPFSSGIIIHRVVEIGEDNKGRYFLTKGDNNPLRDPGKTRFKDIEGVVVGVIY